MPDLGEFNGFFKELNRTVLSVAADVITVDNLPVKKWLLVIASKKQATELTTTTDYIFRFNNDSTAVYARRQSLNQGADTTAINQTVFNAAANNSFSEFGFFLIRNLATREKLIIALTCSNGDATNPLSSAETVGKWVNTTNQINRVDMVNTGTGDYGAGAYMIVLGAD